MPEFLRIHLNKLLLGLLMLTLVASYLIQQKQLEARSASVSLPVTVTSSPSASSALEDYRARREETVLADMAALQSLVDQTDLDDQIRQDAAIRLQQLVDTREKQLALEGALATSGFSPCVAVVSEGSVTVVTEKTTLSSGESALLLTMAQSHTGVSGSGVRVITAEKAP